MVAVKHWRITVHHLATVLTGTSRLKISVQCYPVVARVFPCLIHPRFTARSICTRGESRLTGRSFRVSIFQIFDSGWQSLPMTGWKSLQICRSLQQSCILDTRLYLKLTLCWLTLEMGVALNLNNGSIELQASTLKAELMSSDKTICRASLMPLTKHLRKARQSKARRQRSLQRPRWQRQLARY